MDMDRDLELWFTGKISADTASTCDTPAEIAELISVEAKHKALELQQQLYRDGVKTEAPGEFYVTVGYRTRPKG